MYWYKWWIVGTAAFNNPFDFNVGLQCCLMNERSKTSGCYCHAGFGPDSLIPNIANLYKSVELKCSNGRKSFHRRFLIH